MANTTNLGLGKLAGTEKLKTFPSMQADNMDTLDTAIGAGFGKNSKPSISQSMKNLGGGMAVLCDNNTHAAIPAGHYAYVMNHGTLTEGLYQNLSGSQIAANATLSGSNLTAVSGGGLNSLYSKINSKLSFVGLTSFRAVRYSDGRVQDVHYNNSAADVITFDPNGSISHSHSDDGTNFTTYWTQYTNFFQRDSGNKTTFTFTAKPNSTSVFRLAVIFQHDSTYPSMCLVSFGTGGTVNGIISKVFGDNSNAKIPTSVSMADNTITVTFGTTAYGGCSLLWLW